MNIETYEIEEIQGELGNMAADSEAMELIQTLGLEGQQKLCNGETVTRFPYAKLTAQQELVYSLVFPEKTKVANYGGGIIPLRVLQIISHVQQFNFIKHVEVWHPKESNADDPILVATEKHPTSEWSDGPRYLLARWGQKALLPFETLMEQAKDLWLVRKRIALTKTLKQVQNDLDQLPLIATEAFTTGQVPSLSYFN